MFACSSDLKTWKNHDLRAVAPTMTMTNFKSKDPSGNRSDMRIRFTHTTNGLTRHHKWRPNRRWASTTKKNATETPNLKFFILVKCSSLCCAKWFFTQHSHMLSPPLKQRVHRDDTASEGTTRTNALLVLSNKIRESRPHHSLHESQTHTDANHHSACFAVHIKRTVIETISLAARGQQRRTPDETKTITNIAATLNASKKTLHGKRKKHELPANYLNTRRNVSYLDHERNTKNRKVSIPASAAKPWLDGRHPPRLEPHVIWSWNVKNAPLVRGYNLQRVLNHKRRIFWANNRPESTHPPNRNFRVWIIKRPQKQKRPYADFISWTCMYLSNNIPSLSELSYWRRSRKN